MSGHEDVRQQGHSSSPPIRVLLVTYYFPPSGGAGVQRPLKWVRYLPAAGVEPVVLTVRAGAYPHLDTGMLADVPAGTEVFRTAAPDPFGLYGQLTGRSRGEAVAARTGHVGLSERPAERASRWLRANVFVPDARVGWVPFALRAARRMHRARPFDAVVTTGPPHSAHLVGLALKRAGLPWLADFRDPWTQIHYTGALGRTRLAARTDAALERRVLHAADRVVTVSEPLRDDLLAIAPTARISVVRNGFDPADFAGPPPLVRTDRFELAYVGSLYAVPETLLDALGRLRERGEDVALRVVGSVPEGVHEAAAARGVAVETEAAVPHAEAVDVMRRAAVLLLVVEPWSYAAGVVPGKTFEYLASGRPVLGIGPPGGEAALIVDAAGAGVTLDHGDVDGVARVLSRHRAAWAAGRPEPGAPPDAITAYARPAQAARVADLLRDIARPT